jgi:hypothetical protein
VTHEQFHAQLGLPLTVTRVRKCVRAIAADHRDAEVAHVLEDALHRAVLAHVAAGFDGKEVAAAALKTRKLNFPRWYS